MFWMVDVGDQGINRATLPLETPGEDLCQASPVALVVVWLGQQNSSPHVGSPCVTALLRPNFPFL